MRNAASGTFQHGFAFHEVLRCVGQCSSRVRWRWFLSDQWLRSPPSARSAASGSHRPPAQPARPRPAGPRRRAHRELRVLGLAVALRARQVHDLKAPRRARASAAQLRKPLPVQRRAARSQHCPAILRRRFHLPPRRRRFAGRATLAIAQSPTPAPRRTPVACASALRRPPMLRFRETPRPAARGLRILRLRRSIRRRPTAASARRPIRWATIAARYPIAAEPCRSTTSACCLAALLRFLAMPLRCLSRALQPPAIQARKR